VLTVRTGALGALTAATALLALVAGTVGLGPAGWLVGGAGAGLGTGAAARGFPRLGALTLGPADRITLGRGALVITVAALVADSVATSVTHATASSASVPLLVSLAALALVLDAVDGWVARRTRTATPAGARFDMEVDALLIFVLSIYVARAVGPWVLLIGAARYLFVGAGQIWPWLREPAPPRYWCKVVAAIQGVVLTIAAADLLPRPITGLAVGAALALLAESFGHDVWWLAQRHGSAAGLQRAAGMITGSSAGSMRVRPARPLAGPSPRAGAAPRARPAARR